MTYGSNAGQIIWNTGYTYISHVDIGLVDNSAVTLLMSLLPSLLPSTAAEGMPP